MSRESRDRSLRELMDERGVGALLLSSPANFAWYTGGADNRVDHGDPVGVASVLVTMDDACILTYIIDAPRMREEQTPEMEVVEHPWHEESTELLRELAVAIDPRHVDIDRGQTSRPSWRRLTISARKCSEAD